MGSREAEKRGNEKRARNGRRCVRTLCEVGEGGSGDWTEKLSEKGREGARTAEKESKKN